MKRIVFIGAVFLFFLAGLSGAADSTDYKRIISLGPFISETIYVLGGQDKLAANTTYCLRPAAAGLKPKVGSMVDINIEQIVELSPDIVIATSLTPPATIERLEDLNIKVRQLAEAKSFNQLCQQFIELGRLLGKEGQASQMVQEAQQEVEALSQAAQKHSKLRVFVQIGAKPLFAATGDSLINELVEASHGINIAGPARSGIYSREEVIRQDPDVIIITAMGLSSEEELSRWQVYPSLTAARNNRIYVISADNLCSPTPARFVESLKEFIDIFHESR